MKKTKINNIPVVYYSEFISKDKELFDILWNELDWQRIGLTPRREYYCNDVNKPYTYGKGEHARTYAVQPWHPEILTIKNLVEKELNTKFEVCFLNGYENSKDQLGWHSDNSPEMDDDRPIAIVTLGAKREIWFRTIPYNDGKCVACNGSGYYDTSINGKIPSCGSCNGTGKSSDDSLVTPVSLESGSLCVMDKGMQDTHQHRIPKASYDCGPRISLTFRGYVNSKK